MPFNRPIPGSESKSRTSAGLSGIIQSEKAIQIGLTLPSAVVIGWLLGAWADHSLHQKWIAIAGVIFGGISGLVFVIRFALDSEKSAPRGGDLSSEDESAAREVGNAKSGSGSVNPKP